MFYSLVRSWSPHTLSAKDLHLVCGVSSLRVFTCSTDRTVVMYDVHSGKQVKEKELEMENTFIYSVYLSQC